mmetsp:Transcript_65861/g.212443  ORF Transcript_65861/g.212443 Transcript_65861/m.212443 type:complete len:236 (-) Transcript_65861:275-982(-)
MPGGIQLLRQRCQGVRRRGGPLRAEEPGPGARHPLVHGQLRQEVLAAPGSLLLVHRQLELKLGLLTRCPAQGRVEVLRLRLPAPDLQLVVPEVDLLLGLPRVVLHDELRGLLLQRSHALPRRLAQGRQLLLILALRQQLLGPEVLVPTAHGQDLLLLRLQSEVLPLLMGLLAQNGLALPLLLVQTPAVLLLLRSHILRTGHAHGEAHGLRRHRHALAGDQGPRARRRHGRRQRPH